MIVWSAKGIVSWRQACAKAAHIPPTSLPHLFHTAQLDHPLCQIHSHSTMADLQTVQAEVGYIRLPPMLEARKKRSWCLPSIPELVVGGQLPPIPLFRMKASTQKGFASFLQAGDDPLARGPTPMISAPGLRRYQNGQAFCKYEHPFARHQQPSN